MENRRHWFKKSLAGGLAATLGKTIVAQNQGTSRPESGPVIVSTWDHGLPANEEAWKTLEKGLRPLDAAEAGVRVVEADPKVMTVGLGGFPDRDGFVTLDACIMDETGKAGSVAFLQHIVHPISVARKVMEDTPHVMLVGEGALQFALQEGFKKQNLLTPEAEKAWKEWLKKSVYKPVANIENHDTISLLALDDSGKMAGACTTSGAAFKMHGRVGDSPIIGAGLYVDNEVGGACATGLGELVMTTVGSHLVVELMRSGMSPQQACVNAVKRIMSKYEKQLRADDEMQVGYLAMNLKGEYGAFAIRPGFTYAVRTAKGAKLLKADHLL
jgi:isoaspartyl peptidase/L-asparaginase-like protein (Ntn-hydrolase superfamily)